MDKTTINKPTLKKKHNVLNKLSYLMLAGMILGTGCTKEEERWTDEPYSKLADNRFISYKVTNTGLGEEQPVYSSIDNEKKSITVFLPHYYMVQFLEVEAELPDGAKVSPSLQEIVPVFPEEGKDFTYEVTGKSGEKATYTVKTIVQQPEFSIEELSPSDSEITVHGANAALIIKGKNLVPSYDATTISFWHEDGTLAHKDFEGVTSRGNPSSMEWRIQNKDNLQNGVKYWVQVESYALKAKTQYPIYIKK